MIIRQCFLCDEKFTVLHASNGRKNCDLHLGITTKNHRILAGVLQRKCANCKRWENHDDFYPKDKGRSSWCKRCHSKNAPTRQSEHGWDKRQQLIDYKGGHCISCGYKKNAAALTFHHRDNTTKKFSLDVRKCNGTKMETLKLEADKCDLLCHNCHMEIHYPQYVLS